MSRRPDVDHNNNLHKAASLDNAEALLEKALNLGLVLEEDAFTGHIYFVDRIAPAYKRDWQDDRFGSDRSTAVHNAAFNGNIKAMIYLLRQGWHLDVKNIDSQTPIDILIDEGYEEDAYIILAEYNKGIYGKHAFDNLKEKNKEAKRETRKQHRKEMQDMMIKEQMCHKKYSKMMYVNGHVIITRPYQKVSKKELEKQKLEEEELNHNKMYGKTRELDGTLDDTVMRKIRREMKAETLGFTDSKKVFSP